MEDHTQQNSEQSRLSLVIKTNNLNPNINGSPFSKSSSKAISATIKSATRSIISSTLADSPNNPIGFLLRQKSQSYKSKLVLDQGEQKSPQRITLESLPPSLSRDKSLKKIKRVEKFWEVVDYILDLEGRRYQHINAEAKIIKIPVTFIVCMLFVTVFIAMVIKNKGVVSLSINPLIGPSFSTLYDFGGNVGPFTFGDLEGNWWRLFASNFLHGGFVHLIINISCVLVLFPKARRWYGLPRMLCIHVSTMIGGQIAVSIIRKKALVSVGASGMICGAFGAVLIENL
ncbi:hypothetical protein HK096_001291, partial [Nowakowskiella sp. JEL0078]